MSTAIKEKELKVPVVTMRQLLESGVHFGHQTKRWNPRMKKYIFTARNGIHVIDLQESIKLIKQSYEIVKDIIKKNGTIFFVGTKKQAQDIIEAESIRCGMPHVNHRWLGGTLTNHITIRQSINKLKNYEKMQTDGIFDQLSNKESAKKTVQYMKEGIPIIHSAPIYNRKNNTYGIIDLLVRSDYINKLFQEDILDSCEETNSASKLNGNYHYRVIDVKYHTLNKWRIKGPLRAVQLKGKWYYSVQSLLQVISSDDHVNPES